ncbi:hypothetical protein V6N12_023804 [Hibiscus sabdariffa]|uniref:Uncharacterized protein n=2 Tax=Hibiscus sabdariffa TaxID=183260 RepID=A0ABR2FZ52_9ROSI
MGWRFGPHDWWLGVGFSGTKDIGLFFRRKRDYAQSKDGSNIYESVARHLSLKMRRHWFSEKSEVPARWNHAGGGKEMGEVGASIGTDEAKKMEPTSMIVHEWPSEFWGIMSLKVSDTTVPLWLTPDHSMKWPSYIVRLGNCLANGLTPMFPKRKVDPGAYSKAHLVKFADITKQPMDFCYFVEPDIEEFALGKTKIKDNTYGLNIKSVLTIKADDLGKDHS